MFSRVKFLYICVKIPIFIMKAELYSEIVMELNILGGISINNRFLNHLKCVYTEIPERTLYAIIELWYRERVKYRTRNVKNLDMYKLYTDLVNSGTQDACMTLAEDHMYPPSCISKMVLDGYAAECRKVFQDKQKSERNSKRFLKSASKWDHSFKSTPPFGGIEYVSQSRSFLHSANRGGYNDARQNYQLQQGESVFAGTSRSNSIKSQTYNYQARQWGSESINDPKYNIIFKDTSFRQGLEDNQVSLPSKVKIEGSPRTDNTLVDDVADAVANISVNCSEICKSTYENGQNVIDVSKQETIKLTITKLYSAKQLYKNPHLIEDELLANNVITCKSSDDQYGPEADEFKIKLGATYEKKLISFVENLGIPHNTENMLRKMGVDKTPDVAFTVPVKISNSLVCWMESKAVFADSNSHYDYEEKQYTAYNKRFGPGMVIYWFGFVEDTIVSTDQLMVVDSLPPREAVVWRT